MVSALDVFNPILLFFILNEIVVLIDIPTIFVVGEPSSCVFEMLQSHRGSLTDEIALHFTKGRKIVMQHSTHWLKTNQEAST